MTIRTVRAVAWMLVAVAAVFTLSGCNNAYLPMKVVNNGAYPITAVVLYPAPAAGEAPGPEAQINRMPKDDSGSTVALLPNDATMLDWLFQPQVYQASVTFYDSKNQIFREALAPNPVDLTGVKPNTLIILTAGMDTNNAATIKFEVSDETSGFVTWF